MPDAAAKASALGKRISRIAVQSRKLIPDAFGDAQLNEGPLAVVSFDIDTQELSPTESTLTVEQLWTMRLIDGLLYAPFVDPRGDNSHPENGQYAVRSTDGTWTTITTVSGVTHALDWAITAAGRWLCGANEAEGKAVVWHSTDNGATWAESLTVLDAATIGTDGPRFYALAQFGDDLIVFGRAFNDETAAFAWRWTVGEWTEITPYPIITGGGTWAITDTPASLTIDGTLYVAGIWSTKDTISPGASPLFLIRADGTFLASPHNGMPANVFDVQTDGTHLWALADDLHLWRGDSDGTWTDVGLVDDNTAISLAVPGDGNVYFGSTDSRILRAPIPA